LEKKSLAEPTTLNGITIIPIFVEQNPAYAYLYLFISQEGKRLLYAPCDTKPFPLSSPYVYDVDWLVTQPGFFETGLRGDFVYPPSDLTRTELYSFDETLEIAKTVRAKQVAFVHLEEYWNRSFDDYKKLEKEHDNISFAYDGMQISL
jgi:phosphoribosyl 1,2-cyclic phosphate phosphodiesterase